jgi:Na(+)-translocating NADH:ubiquinone oxidoreductase A subunit
VKIRGGHTPKIAGRPSSEVEDLTLPERLYLNLRRHGIDYTPVVQHGQKVRFGDSLAETVKAERTFILPSPAEGIISLDREEKDGTHRLMLEVSGTETGERKGFQPERITADKIRDALIKGGVWPMFWSSANGGIPELGDGERPRAIVITCVLTEPFRARGKVVLRRAWRRILHGMRFLPRLMEDYGTVEVVLTARTDPVARMMLLDLSGHAWARFHAPPLQYPIENPRILDKAIRKSDSHIKKDDTIWVIDVQGMEAVGACLDEGLPLHQRVVAIGGPGLSQPKHLSVRIGTPVKALVGEEIDWNEVRLLRGGLLRGELIYPEVASVQYDDDAFFFLPEKPGREFLSFMRPGFDRTSFSPCFASRFTGAADRHISASLRGERRPCIACGSCEKVCPAGLMPQVLHRYLHREGLEEAEAAGLHLCVECGLCTYLCPSKIELLEQFEKATEQIELEKQEAEKAAGPT